MSTGAGDPQWAEIERALAVVLELPEEQVEAYLAKLPQAVRVEVESLLAAHRRAGSFLENETGAPPPNTNLRQPVAIKEGIQIGPYRIEAMLGEGGMGMVYRALDTKLNRPVAVKFLSDEVADEAALRRFQREAQMASSLNHPHILTVYDAGDFEGCQYLVTEFVDGGTLKTWARAEKRTWREIGALLTGSRTAWQPRTPLASCIAISSRKTSWWVRMATPSWPTSASQSWKTVRRRTP
jgi:eukaryotic-like serine/threonine-protein kinase